MRILHLVPSLSSGGAERQLRYLVEALAAGGYEVHVAYVHSGSEPSMDWLGSLHKLHANGSSDPLLLLRLVRLMRSLRPDIVQTWLLQMDVAGGLAAMLTRCKWILREPNMEAAYAKSWKFRLRELIATRCDAIVANSAGGADYWLGRHQLQMVRVVHNAIPIRQIRETPKALSVLLAHLQGIPTVMYAGRLVSDKYSEKNVARLLEAIEIVNRTIPCCALIAGAGPQRLALEALATNLGIDSKVVFAGQLAPEELWGAMKCASVFTLVSPYEGMPNSVMEAVVCGCPLVLSDIPAHRELLADDMAIFVNHQNPVSIAQGLLTCLTNPAASRDRAARALTASEHWDIDRMASAYERLYHDVLAVPG